MKPAVVARRSLDDRGDTSLQMAIVFPFIIFLTIAVVQVSLWYYARNVALTAAREGVAAARVYESGPGAGAARAQAVLGRIAGNTLLGPSVSTGEVRPSASGYRSRAGRRRCCPACRD